MNNYDLISNTYDRLGANNKYNGEFFKFYTGTTALISRDLPLIVSELEPDGKILDFGCGTGISTRLLKSVNSNVIGIDVNDSVLDIARENDPEGEYILVEKNKQMPFLAESFAMVVSVLVLMEIPTLKEMASCFNEIRRILKKNGVFVAVVCSEDLYMNHNWLSLVTDYPENENLKSGDFCKIKLTDIGLELTDYFWSNNDYERVSSNAGFEIIKKHFCFGKKEDGVNWKDEFLISPCLIHVFRKF